ncbi:MAG TPA: acyl--CoA ligase family protein [Chloroflexota bacterium]|jgi:fatty-acyl-CoA synthase
MSDELAAEGQTSAAPRAPRANREELTPLSFLTRAAAAFGDRTALMHGARRMTYFELYGRVRRLAVALRAAGLGHGDRVAVLAPNSPVLLESHFGVPLAGGVLVALNTRLVSDEIGYILEHAGARFLLVDTALSPLVAPILARCPAVEQVVYVADTPAESAVPGTEYELFLAAADPDAALPPLASEDEPITINYTSGTTGRPKGAVYTHRGAYLNALSAAFELRMGPDSVYLWTLPMFHCNGWCFPWGATAAGATHVTIRQVDPPVVWELIAREGVTHLCAAPTVLIALANHPSAVRQERAQPVRVATGGAPPSPTTIAQMAALGVEVVHLYGLTETYGPSLACTWWPEWDALTPDERARQKARQGVRHVGVADVRMVDAAGRDVPADGQTMGEVIIRSNTVMTGYYRDEAGTAQAFRGGWFHSGDLGVLHPDGYVELRDRAKDVIITGGENVSTIEVEQAIIRHPAVLEAAVIGVPDPHWGEVPKAFVALKPGAAATAEEIVALCHQQLARFKAPKTVEFGELPKTSTGKIQKYLLREREWAGRDRRIGGG